MKTKRYKQDTSDIIILAPDCKSLAELLAKAHVMRIKCPTGYKRYDK